MRKFFASVSVFALLLGQLLPSTIEVAFASSSPKVELLSGRNYDTTTPTVQYTINPTGLSYDHMVSVIKIMSPATMLAFNQFEGDGNYSNVLDSNAPYQFTAYPSLYMDGVYSLHLSAGGTAVEPAYFSVTPSYYEDDINVELSKSQFLAGDIDFKFTPFSRHDSDYYNYCLTTDVNELGEPTESCEKSEVVNFGQVVMVNSSAKDWNDLEAGQYYLAVQDEFGTWKETPNQIMVIDPLVASLSDTSFEVGSPMGLEVSFSGVAEPYNLEFYARGAPWATENKFGNYQDVKSPAVVNYVPDTPGIYYAVVKTPEIIVRDEFLNDITDSEKMYFTVFEAGENLYLPREGSGASHTGSVNISLIGQSRNSSTTHYCLIEAKDLNSDGRSTDGPCIREGDIDSQVMMESADSIYLTSDDIGTGEYYLTLTDGIDWAIPYNFQFLEPVTFTSDLNANLDYEVGVEVSTQFSITGGLAPYSVELYRSDNGLYIDHSIEKSVLMDNILDNNFTLTFTPENEGRYLFVAKDSSGLITPGGINSQDDWGVTMHVFDSGKSLIVDYQNESQGFILVGDGYQSHTSSFYLTSKSTQVDDAMEYCMTLQDNVNYKTGAPIDLGECISTGTVYASSYGNWTESYWTIPTFSTVVALTVYNPEDGTWATPVDIIVGEFQANFLSTNSYLVEFDEQTNFSIRTNMDCANLYCEYYIHDDPSVSDMDYTYRLDSSSYQEGAIIDTSGWAFSSFYIRVYVHGHTGPVASNVLSLLVRDPESEAFLMEVNGNIAVPFQDKEIIARDGASTESKLATLFWKQDVTATVNDPSWNGQVTVQFTSDIEEISPEVKENFKEEAVVRKVSVNTNLGHSVQLDDEVVVVIPLPADFSLLDEPTVIVVDGDGVSTEISACDVLFSGDAGNLVSVSDPDNYNVPDNEACYVVGTGATNEFLFVATRHLTDFIVGERGAANAGNGGGAVSSTTYSVTTGYRPDVEGALSDNLALEHPLTSNNYFADLIGEASRYAVNTFKEMGVIEGYQDGLFRPNAVISRAEFIKILTVLMNLDLDFATDSGELFLDTHFGDWYYPYVKAAVNRGIIAGADDGNFYPHTPLNVAEVAVILHRIIQSQFDDIPEEFELPVNVDRSAWYYEALRFANYYNVLSGVDASVPVTRGEATIRLYNVFMR